ncbi:MAG: Na+/H+ antiporter subunit E [Gluconacetobacter diazotrophicus]|nr:Na+/H+ antiporter subunit E [Gluconacetobacter diazotrophicus]
MTALLVAVVWILLFGFNLLLTWTASPHELIVGVVIVTVSALFFGIAHRERARDLLVRPAPRVILSPLPRLVSESWRVGAVLLRILLSPGRRPEPVGVVSVQPFREGGRDRRNAGRRALVVLSGSVTPNGFALDIPEREDRLVLHRLSPEPPDPDREWPA